MSLLANTGALRLIHAHQVSLTHFQWLSRAQSDAVRPTTKKEKNKGSNLPRFLDALVSAQQSETLLGHRNHEGENAVLY